MERNVCETTFNIYNDMRLEKKFCDGIISVEGVEFHVHKIILCGCSLYFKSLFTNGWHSSHNSKCNIPGVSSKIMELIMEYVYMQPVNITSENVCELLIAADYLALIRLVNDCCTCLKVHMCVENCIGIWGFAKFYSCKKLKEQAFQFNLYNFEKIVHVSEEFLDLTVEQLSEIIEKDELNVKKENMVFEAILKWTEKNPLERKAHVTMLLRNVRLELLPDDYFLNKVKNNVLESNTAVRMWTITRVLMDICGLNLTSSLSSYHRRPRLPSSVLLTIGSFDLFGFTNSIVAYDTRADLWINVPYEDKIPLCNHETVYLNGFVYCIGGTFQGTILSNVRKFNPITRTWTQVGPMHLCRSGLCVCVLDGCIYAMGGYDGHNWLNTAELYDPEHNQWSMIAPMNEQRCDASATVLHGKVYVCGGFDGNVDLFTAEFYYPQTDQWTFISRMLRRRSGLGVITYDKKVYAVGGYSYNHAFRKAEVYDPERDSWKKIPDMINKRCYFGIGVLDDLLFVVGGRGPSLSYVTKAEYYDKESNKWYEMKDFEFSSGNLSCCVLSGLPNMADYTVSRDLF